MHILIVIPTYNEIDNIEKLTLEIQRCLPQADILIVDDNSPDGTGQLAGKLAKRNSQISVLNRPAKLGLGSAYVQGFRYALAHNYDAVFTMDADLSHDPSYFGEFLAELSTHALVLGSRYVRGGGITRWGIWRRCLSYGANFYARTILGLSYRDFTGGFKCYRRDALEALGLNSIISEGYVFQIETTYRVYRKGLAIKEIPIVFRERHRGASKISRRICFEAIWKIPLLRLRLRV
ncbi:MAG: polyprenol monophosphomannose synthase [Candidatus Omnitrophota bacterium]